VVRQRSLRPVWAIAAGAAVLRGLMVGGLELYADEAYYWMWSRRLAPGYFDHPPMVAWLVRLSSAVWPGEMGVRILFFLCGGLAVAFAGLIARELCDDPGAPALAALLAAAAPLLTLTGALALPDAPVEAAYAAGTWLISRARGRRWLLAGVAVGLALLSKYTAALLAPALLLLVFWDRELREELRRPWPWAGALLATALFLPCLLWNARHDFVSIRFQIHHGFGGRATLGSFLEYLGGQLLGPGPVVLPLALAVLSRARTSVEKRAAAATLFPLLVTTWSALQGPVEVNWGALAHPGLCAAAAAGLFRLSPRPRQALAAASVALGLALALAFAVEVRVPRFAPSSSPLVERFNGWRELARKARQAAALACAEAGSPPGCDAEDPFVFPVSYQLASELAYYAGWRRFGPSQERQSQLDLWGDLPLPGAAYLYLGNDATDDGAGGHLVRGEGKGRTVAFDVRLRGDLVRSGSVTSFSRFLRFGPRPGAALQ
jgi:4-amino-4-deoxy-L-arabinose transferase-like glycosyltransferase